MEQDAPTSGVIVDSSGFILASSLVAARPRRASWSSYRMELDTRPKSFPAIITVILPSENQSAGNLDPIVFPPQLDLRIGRTTVAVGRYGRQGSPMVSTGVLSAIDRLDGIALQTDARVSPAFYGGPLIDLNGNVSGDFDPGGRRRWSSRRHKLV